MAAPGLINSKVNGEIEVAPGTIVSVPLAGVVQLPVSIVVKDGAAAGVTTTVPVTCAPHTSVNRIV
jgi:hypothetical protein